MGAPSQPSTFASPLARALSLAYGAAGIYAAYLTQGIVQEKLATRRYGAAGDRFPGLDALHGVQVRGRRGGRRDDGRRKMITGLNTPHSPPPKMRIFSTYPQNKTSPRPFLHTPPLHTSPLPS